ncbi:MAG: amino acid--tRNA ligase-related protein, partial [Planctomycetota bacterium]
MSKPQDSANTTDELLANRKAKLDRLRDEFGQDPYGHRVDGLTSLADAKARFDEAADQRFKDDPEAGDHRPTVRVAGRVMQHRVMGNLVFMSLRDATGDLQIAVSKKAVGPEPFKIASKLTDLADLVVAQGPLGTTKTGEITIWAGRVEGSSVEGQGSKPDADSTPNPQPSTLDQGFALITKSLALPPGKFHGLQDAEQRYRKRYVDLHTNPDVMKTMQQRIAIIDAIRDYLRDHGFAEVETPMLQTLHGGAAARPFHTHHNALDLPLTLRIAPELYLKRLLVGGMPKVFEINRNFRNEGISPRHNPEFTMLEAYEAFGSWETMADLVEDMVCTAAEKVFGTLKIEHTNEEGEVTRTINLQRPWRRVSMIDLVEERTGWKFDKRSLAEADPEFASALADDVAHTLLCERSDKYQDAYRAQGNEPNDLQKATHQKRFTAHVFDLTPAEQLVEVYEKFIEPTLIDPCFVTHVPSVIIPLAKKNADDPFFADVYELAINGVEISPGYSEL